MYIVLISDDKLAYNRINHRDLIKPNVKIDYINGRQQDSIEVYYFIQLDVNELCHQLNQLIHRSVALAYFNEEKGAL